MSTTSQIIDRIDSRRRALISHLRPDYFWTKALVDGSFTISIPASVTPSMVTSIDYSLDDGITWTRTLNIEGEAVTITTPIIPSGRKVLWKGEAKRYASNYSSANASLLTGSSHHEIGGNIASLLYGENFLNSQFSLPEGDCTFFSFFKNSKQLRNAGRLILPAKSTKERCYQSMFEGCSNLEAAPTILIEDSSGYYDLYGMFSNCTSLIKAPELHIRKTSRGTCWSMFQGCTSLTTPPPELPASTLAASAYYRMFYGCTKLASAPIIRATTLGTSALYQMFYNCKSLATAPELIARVLSSSCYSGLFQGCSALSYIKMMATDISASGALSNWVKGVTASGTFVKNAAAEWELEKGDSGIPENYTTITVSE